jgi:hypothetical protein
VAGRRNEVDRRTASTRVLAGTYPELYNELYNACSIKKKLSGLGFAVTPQQTATHACPLRDATRRHPCGHRQKHRRRAHSGTDLRATTVRNRDRHALAAVPAHEDTRGEWLSLFLQSLFGTFLFTLWMLNGPRHTSAVAAGVITRTIAALGAVCCESICLVLCKH